MTPEELNSYVGKPVVWVSTNGRYLVLLVERVTPATGYTEPCVISRGQPYATDNCRTVEVDPKAPTPAERMYRVLKNPDVALQFAQTLWTYPASAKLTEDQLANALAHFPTGGDMNKLRALRRALNLI